MNFRNLAMWAVIVILTIGLYNMFKNPQGSVNKKNNLVELNKRLKKIESIENIYVQQLNNKYVFVKLKYFGKLNKIIKQLSDQNILLQFSEDQWSLKIS